jgi:hypothetical protein
MKNHVLVVGFLLSISFTGAVQAQNKTLGVGVASPNPNAALHVESPTANQGFIMPRLTTAQRTNSGFVSVLSSTDIGLMVFDIDLARVFTWDGSQWDDTSVDANVTGTGNAGMFQINNASNASNALEATTNGTGGAAKFKVTNAASIMPAMWAETNSNQPLSAPIFGLNTGTGDVAASFRINNAASVQPALFVETNGTGRGAFIRRTSTTGSAPGLYVTSASGHGVWSDHNGATGYAGIFQNINTANPSAGIMAETIGTGPSIWAIKSTDAVGGDAFNASNDITTGRAAFFEITSTENLQTAVQVNTAGQGSAGVFQQTHTGVFSPALVGRTNGMGAAVVGTSTSTSPNANASEFTVQNPSNPRFAVMANTVGTGSAGSFEINNAGSGAPSVFASTNGTGAAIQGTTSTGFTSIYGRREGAANGNAGLFEITNASNTYPALQANTTGTGAAANFQINNGSSNAPAVFALTNGPGSGISADNTSTGDAIFALKTGSAGSAGNFQSNNASNGAATIFGMTNASTGTAIGLINSANGNAMTIFTGGMRVSSATVTTSTITARAAAYFISSGGTTFSLSFPQAVADGEVFFIYNSTASSITVDGASIPASSGKTCIYLGGALRAL